MSVEPETIWVLGAHLTPHVDTRCSKTEKSENHGLKSADWEGGNSRMTGSFPPPFPTTGPQPSHHSSQPSCVVAHPILPRQREALARGRCKVLEVRFSPKCERNTARSWRGG